MQHVRDVIKATTTPSWINSVPTNYGDARAGTIKADEWRTLSVIYLPIALTTLWGDENGAPPPENAPLLPILDHSMALFQAVTLVCRYTTNKERAMKFCHLLKDWVDGLYTLFPHVRKHKKRDNVHMSFHLYDFLLLFGPVVSWWAFPFERLIGKLQRIETNDKIGGERMLPPPAIL